MMCLKRMQWERAGVSFLLCVLPTDAAHTAEKTVSSVSASSAGVSSSVASAGSSLSWCAGSLLLLLLLADELVLVRDYLHLCLLQSCAVQDHPRRARLPEKRMSCESDAEQSPSVLSLCCDTAYLEEMQCSATWMMRTIQVKGNSSSTDQWWIVGVRVLCAGRERMVLQSMRVNVLAKQ